MRVISRREVRIWKLKVESWRLEVDPSNILVGLLALSAAAAVVVVVVVGQAIMARVYHSSRASHLACIIARILGVEGPGIHRSRA